MKFPYPPQKRKDTATSEGGEKGLKARSSKRGGEGFKTNANPPYQGAFCKTSIYAKAF